MIIFIRWHFSDDDEICQPEIPKAQHDICFFILQLAEYFIITIITHVGLIAKQAEVLIAYLKVKLGQKYDSLNDPI